MQAYNRRSRCKEALNALSRIASDSHAMFATFGMLFVQLGKPYELEAAVRRMRPSPDGYVV